MIQQGIDDFDDGLYAACEGGHKELVELIIVKGAYDLNGDLNSACYGGHKALAELMITKGASEFNSGLPVNEVTKRLQG